MRSGVRNQDMVSRTGVCGIISVLTLAAVLSVGGHGDSFAARKTADDLVPGRINPTGRVIQMPVPLKEKGGAALGEITAKLNPDDSVELPKAALLQRLKGVVTSETVANVAALSDRSGFVRLGALRKTGVDVRFDPNALEVIFIPSIDQRPTGELSLARRSLPKSPNVVAPAFFSGYVNLSGGADYLWGNDRGNDGLEGPRFDVEAVMRMGNVILESEFTYEGESDSGICPSGAICVGTQIQGFKRRGTRLVYDVPSEMLRVTLGDTDTLVTRLQRSVDVLGVTLEKSPRTFAPGQNIRPTGRQSFRLERPSDVEIVINGSIVRKLRLRPGNYNLSDLPLRSGANDVELIISDDVGETRRLSFSTFSGLDLLKPGTSIWSASGGVPSFFRDNDVTYREGEWFATGFYRQGLTNSVTGEVLAQADQDVVLAGGGLLMQSPLGYFGIQVAGSNSDAGTGVGVDFDWDVVNFQGLSGSRESFRFTAAYRSEQFRQPGEFSLTDGDVIFPVFDTWLRLAASYSMPLDYGITATLSGRYQFVDDDRISLTGTQLQGDRFGGDITLSAPLGRQTSGSLLLGYTNEAFSSPLINGERDGEFRAGIRLFWRPDTKTRIAASYDTRDNRTFVSGGRSYGRGVGRWDTSVNVQHDNGDERASGGASVSYSGNRFEARIAHTSGFDGIAYDDFKATPSDQRTSIRVGTSIAFADGTVAVGAPIRSGGFAIVKPHESIGDKTVVVGSKDNVRAIADGWGAAVVTSVPNYTRATIPYDVDDLPVGYSLGTSVFDLYAPYRGGYNLTVGSAYSVSVFGTMIGRDGEPIALLTGTARSASAPGKEVLVFTNRAGKFGADGLAPGRWTIEMATDRPTTFVVDIPEGTEGLYRAGVLRPVK